MINAKMLVLFCGAGGESMGYWQAGFDIFGVDIEPQPNYPFDFQQADALEFVKAYGHCFDAIAGGPPCQHYSMLNSYNHCVYPDLISATRDAFTATGKPWIIENVPQAPLIDPITLRGDMFGLKLYRSRCFESSVLLTAPALPIRTALCARNGYLPTTSRPFMSIHGGKHSKAWQRAAAECMGVPWMTTIKEVCEAIPPAYTSYIGRQMLEMIS